MPVHGIGGHLPLFLMQQRAAPAVLLQSGILVPVFPGAANTGLAGIGVNPGSLTPQGATTYSTSQTVTGKKFTGQVQVTGDDVILSGCQFAWGGADTIPVLVNANRCKIQDCQFLPTTGLAYYICVEAIGGDGLQVLRCDMSTCENGVTLQTTSPLTNVTIQGNYIHDLTGPDCDGIEVYAGSFVNILGNTLVQGTGAGNESSVNIAPWQPGVSVDHVTMQGNFMDGGIVSIVVDDTQSTGTITYAKIVANYFGGHNDPAVVGIYNALQNNGSQAITHDDAAQAANPASIQFPNSGGNVNYWWNCTGLTPDRSGQTINEG